MIYQESRNSQTVTLPHGVWLDGTRHQDAVLRDLTGDDEAFLVDLGPMPTAHWVTKFLCRSLARLGPLSEINVDIVRSLVVGDREALLLHALLRLSGDPLSCVVNCPAAECGEQMAIELPGGEILQQPYSDPQPYWPLKLQLGDSEVEIEVRLPTGADQEAVTRFGDLQNATLELVRRCVKSSEALDVGELTPSAVDQIGQLMCDCDPQAELVVNVECISCDQPFSANLDAGSFLLRDLNKRSRTLYRQVHDLALHYHWSESEILSLPMKKRHRYLELLEESLTGVAGE